jgi:hypothetical protein
MRLPTKYEANTNSWITTEDASHNKIENWVLEIAEPCVSLISVLPIQRTLHFSATSEMYFSQLTIPASYSFQIWESSMHSSAITESSQFRRL